MYSQVLSVSENQLAPSVQLNANQVMDSYCYTISIS